MPRAVVLLPTTTYRADDFVRAAQSLGVDLVVASEGPPPLDMGDAYVEIDCSDPDDAADAIVAVADRIGVDGVVAADDAGVVAAALAGEKLHVRSNPPEAARATRDKSAMRRLLGAAEVPQPDYQVLGPAHPVETSLEYPLVVKPVDRSASQGVIKASSPAELDAVVRRVRGITGEGTEVLLETYLEGDEVALEGLVRDGRLDVLAIFDKPGGSTGPYFPETIMLTPSRLPPGTQAECERVAQRAVTAVGLTHGPVHIELKIHGSRVAVVEVAARSIGGLCSRSLNFGLMGTTLETLILRNALGMDKPELRREKTASGVLMIPIPRSGTLTAVNGVEETLAIEGVTGVEVTVNPGNEVTAVPEGDRYLGFVFARAVTPAEVEKTLLRAKEMIGVEVA